MKKRNRRGRATGKPDAGTARRQGAYWIYGDHAVEAALSNPRRAFHRLVLRRDDAIRAELRRAIEARAGLQVDRLDGADLAELLEDGAAHQGIAAQIAPLDPPAVEDLLDEIGDRTEACILVLDQVTDPRNVGAILRSAAAFQADGVVIPARRAPPETATLAKAASGALERAPMIPTANLSRAIKTLKEGGFWCIGLAGAAETALPQIDLTGRVALALGAEGDGLRRLTREQCDHLAFLPTAPEMPSLNVSVAASIALYERARQRGLSVFRSYELG